MTPKDVLKLAKEKGVKIVDLRFIDLPGLWQHFSIPMSELSEGIFEDGLGFDGSSIRGFQTIDESDMLLIPDPSTAQMDPFTAVPTLVLICNVKDPVTGKAYTRDPRYIAQKAEAYVKKTGLADTIYIGPELEFFFFDSIRFDQNYNSGYYFIDSEAGAWNSGKEGTPEQPNLGYKPRYKQGYFPVPPMDQFQDIRSEMVLALETVGVRVEVHHHEVATGGQTEIDMRFDTLTKMADKVMLVQVLRQEHRAEAGQDRHLHAQAAVPGQRLGHAHAPVALEERQEPLLRAGRLRRHLARCASTTSAASSSTRRRCSRSSRRRPTRYRRLVPGYEAPINLVYSQRNRSAAIRIPMYSKSEGAKRIEFRTPDPTCNPYLSFAAMRDGRPRRHREQDRSRASRWTRTSTSCRRRSRRRSSSCPGVARRRARQPGEGPRVPAQGRRLHAGRHRDLDRVQAEERGRPGPAAPASVRVRALLRHLGRRPRRLAARPLPLIGGGRVARMPGR